MEVTQIIAEIGIAVIVGLVIYFGANLSKHKYSH